MSQVVGVDPLSYEFQENPYPHYARLRDEAPVSYIEALGVWGLFRYDDVAGTFMNPAVFSARDFIVNAFGEFDPVPEVPSIISLDPPEHTRLRKLANRAFLPSAIKAVMPDVEKVIDDLIAEIKSRGSNFDFVSDFAAYVPVSVTASLLGVDATTARGDFKRWTRDMLKAPSRTALAPDELAGMTQSVADFRAYFADQIAFRRRSPGSDLISALVRAEEDDQTLSATEVLSLVALIMFGGAETPSHLISSVLYELFENPDAMAAVRSDPTRMTQAVDETLRHVSPVHFVFQTALSDAVFDGGTVPAGATVFSFVGSANRDPAMFEDPDRFVLGRANVSRHLAFAHGPHYCIGAQLGRLMAATAVNSVLGAMPAIRRDSDGWEWMPSFWVRGLQTFPVAF